jgi:hypothetical protein
MAAGFLMAGGGGLYAASLLFPPKELDMTNLLNPKPRFGLNPTTGTVYDYIGQRDITPTAAPYVAIDGTWDLNKVKAAILAGENIEQAHLTVKVPVQKNASIDAKKPDAPKPAAPAAGKPAAPVPGKPIPSAPLKAMPGLSPEQLTALKLSAIQAAALGITATQMNVTGVTGQQVANWGMNAQRADALKLTADQRKVLLP